MNIDAAPVNMTIDTPIMREMFGVVIKLELTTTKGLPHTVHLNQCFPRVPTEYLEKPATLGDLISLIIRRQHPQIQYIAERNGIRVIQFRERWSLSQAFEQIGYSS